jgi:bifunctional oligoribonuclease and PAP phosphatase NrnA
MTQNQIFDVKPGLLAEKIAKAQNILITSHHNPDGDAIGSCLGLYHYLAAIGKKSKIVIPNAFPGFLAWMKAADRIVVFDEQTNKASKIIEAADLIFSLDYNSFSRTKFFEKQLVESKAYKVLIDHHLSPDEGFDHIISRIDVSSTAELIYETIASLGHENLITKELAECLFVGIMTDTGSFSFSCNYPSTFQLAAILVQKGADAEKVHQYVYDTYSEDRMRLLGFCLSEKLVVLKDYGTAYISLTRHELENFRFQPGDTEGVVNYALSVKNIVFAVLFTEKDDGVRMSFRSKGEFSVNEFARTHFKGGGHKNAAGADSEYSLDETITRFVGLLQGYKESLQEFISMEHTD